VQERVATAATESRVLQIYSSQGQQRWSQSVYM